MKKTVLATFILLHTSLIFAGPGGSKMEKPKMKLASEGVLRKRAKASNFNDEFTEFLATTFADKEIAVDELDAGFASLSDKMWAEAKKQIQKEAGTVGYYGLYPVISRELNKELAKLKPQFLEILLKEDYPELYEEISEKE